MVPIDRSRGRCVDVAAVVSSSVVAIALSACVASSSAGDQDAREFPASASTVLSSPVQEPSAQSQLAGDYTWPAPRAAISSEVGPVDVLDRFSRTGVLVRSSTVVAEPPVDVRNGAGDAITLFPTSVVVDDVIWSDAELDPQHRVVAPVSLRALDSRDIALAGQSVRDRDLIVGLQPRLQIPSEDIDYDFIVTFVVEVTNDGKWSILGPLAERLNIEAATLQAHLGLGLVDMVRTARSEYLASSEQTTVAYEAMIASLTEPDSASSWDKLDPTERDLTLTEIPSSLRGEVEAIGIEVVVADAATTVDDQLVSKFLGTK